MLALSIALGTIILFAIFVAIKLRTETPGIESEKLTQEQDAKPHGPPKVNGSSAVTQMTGKGLVQNIDTDDGVSTTTLPAIFDITTKEDDINIDDQNWVTTTQTTQKPVENRTESTLMENATIAENGNEIVRENETVFDGNVPKRLQATNDTPTNQSNRAYNTAPLLCWQFISYLFIIFFR